MNLGQTMFNVAITGGTGFIGSEIIKILTHQGISCFTFGKKKNDNYYFALGEPVDEYILDNVDLLIHAAWDFQCNKEAIFEVNALGAIPILDLALRHDIPVLNISTLAAHEFTLSQYGFSKLFLEHYLSAYPHGTSIRLGAPILSNKLNRFDKLANISRFLPFNLIPGSENSFIFKTRQHDFENAIKYYASDFKTISGVYRVCDSEPILISSLFELSKLNIYLGIGSLKFFEVMERILPIGFTSDNLISLINQINVDEFNKLRVFPTRFTA